MASSTGTLIADAKRIGCSDPSNECQLEFAGKRFRSKPIKGTGLDFTGFKLNSVTLMSSSYRLPSSTTDDSTISSLWVCSLSLSLSLWNGNVRFLVFDIFPLQVHMPSLLSVRYLEMILTKWFQMDISPFRSVSTLQRAFNRQLTEFNQSTN